MISISSFIVKIDLSGVSNDPPIISHRFLTFINSTYLIIFHYLNKFEEFEHISTLNGTITQPIIEITPKSMENGNYWKFWPMGWVNHCWDGTENNLTPYPWSNRFYRLIIWKGNKTLKVSTPRHINSFQIHTENGIWGANRANIKLEKSKKVLVGVIKLKFNLLGLSWLWVMVEEYKWIS